ncbi:hypothetical protein DN752_22420 [Echinicola strongylocentroti]|uniref:HmuY protein n=1 Tax=Echinicola strongylocentroti TaxID=1795355 RepID=A0A2Z4IQ52_9BACT|nr:HmuY family protein [Echinicola strongylocentroti]AWW32676.1 hypothetical protein DN752_22420 [Echinicola strongylocentroti]
MKKVNFIALAMLAMPLFVACTNDEDTEPEVVEELEAVMVEDLYAPNSNPGSDDGQEYDYVYYSFEKNTVVDSKDEDWDIAFKSTEIIVNGGVNGDGNVKGALLSGTVFEELEGLPDDMELSVDTEEMNAIPNDMQNGWWNYDRSTHFVTPKAAIVLVFQTNSGNSVKMEILSFFKGNPPAEEYELRDMYHYTFRYVLQPNGTKTF